MALYFTKEEADEIKKMPLMFEVINKEGIQTQKRGNLISMLCPLHNDEHFGSCFVNAKNAYCHVCKKSIRPIGFLTSQGYKYYDALTVLAEMGGVSSLYEQKGNGTKRKKKNPPAPKKLYNWEEAEFLGFPPYIKGIGENYSFMPFEVSKGEKLSKEVQEDGNVLYFHEKKTGNPLADLEKEDPEAFKYIITQKAKEKMLDAIVTYDLLKNEAGFSLAPNFFKQTTFQYVKECELLDSIQKAYEKAEKILEKFGEKIPTKKELIAEMYILNAIS